ncbi:hypothetical protein RRG08_046757 [Elysia crispata]|uniref:Uncharacterized protein n=1 Tax=Elysia crispata TaxID=231223 RepID=A0AAE0ZV27_9GAST|nr:hypothetical protein RRG08_046757 [Elysia crispata]
MGKRTSTLCHAQRFSTAHACMPLEKIKEMRGVMRGLSDKKGLIVSKASTYGLCQVCHLNVHFDERRQGQSMRDCFCRRELLWVLWEDGCSNEMARYTSNCMTES